VANTETMKCDYNGLINKTAVGYTQGCGQGFWAPWKNRYYCTRSTRKIDLLGPLKCLGP